MNTADANVIAQIFARGDDFPKATRLYRHVDIYGKNVVSSGGATWRWVLGMHFFGSIYLLGSSYGIQNPSTRVYPTSSGRGKG